MRQLVSKTLVIWHGSEETEDSRGAALTFTTDELIHKANVRETPHSRPKEIYYLLNRRGEVVAELTIHEGAHAREV